MHHHDNDHDHNHHQKRNDRRLKQAKILLGGNSEPLSVFFFLIFVDTRTVTGLYRLTCKVS